MKREPGYYWVKDFGVWIVVRWTGHVWVRSGGTAVYNFHEFQTIDERRILNPDEQPKNENNG